MFVVFFIISTRFIVNVQHSGFWLNWARSSRSVIWTFDYQNLIGWISLEVRAVRPLLSCSAGHMTHLTNTKWLRRLGDTNLLRQANMLKKLFRSRKSLVDNDRSSKTLGNMKVQYKSKFLNYTLCNLSRQDWRFYEYIRYLAIMTVPLFDLFNIRRGY